jgi:hypothetical protein
MRSWTHLASLAISLALGASVVDQILADLYAGRMGYITLGVPNANLGGSNAPPTGIYQAMVPPTSGKETKYDLINDPASEHFKRWTITTN